jgi:trimeric autotransporter adhesin
MTSMGLPITDDTSDSAATAAATAAAAAARSIGSVSAADDEAAALEVGFQALRAAHSPSLQQDSDAAAAAIALLRELPGYEEPTEAHTRTSASTASSRVPGTAADYSSAAPDPAAAALFSELPFAPAARVRIGAGEGSQVQFRGSRVATGRLAPWSAAAAVYFSDETLHSDGDDSAGDSDAEASANSAFMSAVMNAAHEFIPAEQPSEERRALELSHEQAVIAANIQRAIAASNNAAPVSPRHRTVHEIGAAAAAAALRDTDDSDESSEEDEDEDDVSDDDTVPDLASDSDNSDMYSDDEAEGESEYGADEDSDEGSADSDGEVSAAVEGALAMLFGAAAAAGAGYAGDSNSSSSEEEEEDSEDEPAGAPSNRTQVSVVVWDTVTAL